MKTKKTTEKQMDILIDTHYNPHDENDEETFRNELSQIVPKLTEIFKNYGQAEPDNILGDFRYGYEVFNSRNYLFSVVQEVAERLDYNFILKMYEMVLEHRTWMFVVNMGIDFKPNYIVFKDDIVHYFISVKRMLPRLGFK